ncbi:hypothetical protein BDV12DRAFT_171324 [Aspergillus spectabilis]
MHPAKSVTFPSANQPARTMSFPTPLPMATKNLLDFLRGTPGMTWGFVIYRTTYTPQSNLQFPKLLDIFQANIQRRISTELEPSSYIGHSRADNELLMARYRPVVMDNPKFNKLSIPEVRSHFEAWVGLPDQVMDDDIRPDEQKSACLVIDEEVMEVLADAKPYRREDYPVSVIRHWVKAVEAYPDDDGLEYLKVPIPDLWSFWSDLSLSPRLEEWIHPEGYYVA